jgi:hypothetical protein
MAGAALLLAAGCGGEDFANNPRPPASVSLTGVIQDTGVTISPDKVGAGPVSITISNQTSAEHSVMLEGTRVRERFGPINPLDTATIQKTLQPGRYKVSAGSAAATPREIKPDTLVIGRERPDSSNQLLQP